MIRPIAFAAVLAFALLQACSGKNSQDDDQLKAKIAELGWLVGNWEGRVESDKIYEQWVMRTDNTLKGRGYIISGKSLGEESQPLDTIFSEEIEIVPKDGEVVYLVKMAGQENTAFAATEISAGKAVFENPKHDFPSRILYQLQTNGSLTATIEGTINGKPARETFTMRRTQQAL